MADEQLPRLPPRLEPVQLEFEQAEVDPTELVLKTPWAAFPEPDLLGTNRIRPALLVARCGLFLWAVGVVIAAIAARSNATGGADRGTSVTLVGWLGLVAVLVLSALGWRWSDRKTHNIHLLEARLPTRFWCIRAWLAPLLWFAVLSATVLQLEPTELLDIRPPIVVPVFAAALWRPYALVRRILASLIRIRSDALVGTAYVLDLAAFGLLWWQLWTLPNWITSSNVGTLDVFIGVGAAAAVALGANIAIWATLLRTVEHAEAHRLTAIRTRHDHRQLRLRGIDPMDRQVRWALLRIKQARNERPDAPAPTIPTIAEERARAAREWVDSMVPAARQYVSSPEVAESEVVAESEQAVEFEQAVESEQAVEPEVVAESEQAVESEVVVESEQAVESEVVVESEQAVESEVVVESDQEPDATPPTEEPDSTAGVSLPAADRSVNAARLSTRLQELGTGHRATADDARVFHFADRNLGQIDDPQQDQPAARATRLREALRHLPEIGESGAKATDRFARTGRLLEDNADLGVSGESLLGRLREYGITPGPATPEPIRDAWHSEPADDSLKGWVPPRVYPLEIARYVLILSILAIVVTSLWLTYRSVSVGNRLVDGMIGNDDLRQLDLARRAAVVSLGITTAVVSLWAAALTAYARRTGALRLARWPLYALFAIAVGLNVGAYVLDGSTRGTVNLLFLIGSLATALVAAWLLSPIQRWLDPRLMTASLWTGGMALVVLASWIGRLQRPVESTDALEALTFISAFQTIVAGVIAVVVTSSTSDLVDEIQLALAGLASAGEEGEGSESGEEHAGASLTEASDDTADG